MKKVTLIPTKRGKDFYIMVDGVERGICSESTRKGVTQFKSILNGLKFIGSTKEEFITGIEQIVNK